MPTFEDPKADAHELGQAARGLAYATRHIETPTHPRHQVVPQAAVACHAEPLR